MTAPSACVLINTSDGFQDCWPAFFSLFEKYALSLADELPVYLNTERVKYPESRIGVRSLAVWSDGGPRPSWSECLRRALETIPQDYVLYMQEDYFLTQPLRAEIVQAAILALSRDAHLDAVYLNRWGPIADYSGQSARDGLFVTVPRRASYYVSTQAAVWRRSSLHSLVRHWENGWMFEKFASIRAKRQGMKFYSLTPRIMAEAPAVDYVYTGVMKGQWNQQCVELFKRENISMDFSRRGFYQERGRMKSRLEVATKLFRRPDLAFRSLWTCLT
jgi:hypothetical protein